MDNRPHAVDAYIRTYVDDAGWGEGGEKRTYTITTAEANVLNVPAAAASQPTAYNQPTASRASRVVSEPAK